MVRRVQSPCRAECLHVKQPLLHRLSLISSYPQMPERALTCPQPYQGGEASDGRRVYVGNINYDFREEEIRGAFTEVLAVA